MSVFSFPRLHVKGLLAVNVGTGNNDDYSNVNYNGQPLRLADSIMVQPVTFGMDDATFVPWAQKAQPVTSNPNIAASFRNKGSGQVEQANVVCSPQPGDRRIPGEWNYYGDMALTMQDVKIISVQTSPSTFNPTHPYMGAQLSFNNRPAPAGGTTGMLIDVNPEGVPCSQVFADFLTLIGSNSAQIMSGKPSKAVTRWINFQRNSRLAGPNGAGAYFYCVVPIQAIEGQPIVQFMTPPGNRAIAGVVFRYYMYRSLQPINVFKYAVEDWWAELEELYAKGQSGKYNYPDLINPTYVQLSGTLSPYYPGEMQSVSTGRVLAPDSTTITIKAPNPPPPPPPPLPPEGESSGNGAPGSCLKDFQLAPAVLQINAAEQRLSIDFIGSFPDQYKKNTGNPYNPLQTDNNPKMDFGPVSLVFREGGTIVYHWPIPYTNTDQGDRQGWLYDFSIAGIPIDKLRAGKFALATNDYQNLLVETEYLVASDQSCIFGEQNGSPNRFTNDGPTEEPATIRVFRRGEELTATNCPPIAVWQYAQVPNQDQNNFKRVQIMSNYKPGQALVVNTQLPGVFLFTFTVQGQPLPPDTAADLDLMNIPMINLRMLPNNKDYSQYYKDPRSPEPVGNDKLTFQVIFQEVLRNYYLLYPSMNTVIPLNDPQQWEDAEMARRMLAHTQKSMWNQYGYMPRTRDLSASRRTLLQAWARKYLQP